MRCVRGVSLCRDEAVKLYFSGSEFPTFYGLVVNCQDQKFPFHAAETKKYLPLVDKGRSTFMTLAGAQILDKAVYRAEIDTPFFLARDMESKGTLVASEAFRTLVQSRGLAIDFIPA